MLTSLIYFNQIEIIQYIQKNDTYTNALFRLYERKEEIETDKNEKVESEKRQTESQRSSQDGVVRKRRDGVRFVHQMSIVAKSFPLQQRAMLYSNFIRHGLFNLIDFALKDRLLSIRVLGSELMVTIIEQDPNLVRYAVDKDDIDKENVPSSKNNGRKYNETVINVFIDLLNNDEDLGLKSQAAEALKVLLDVAGGGNYGTNSSSVSLSSLGMVGEQQQKILGDDFESQFYSKSAPRLFSKLIKLSSIPTVDCSKEITFAMDAMSTIEGRASYEQLCDLLSFCIRQHRIPCRNFVINFNLWSGISKLICVRHKQVRLAAIRCLKQGTLTDDIYYIRSICLSDALSSLLDVLVTMSLQNNLIHSSCLELLVVADSISSQQSESRHPVPTREIINHLVENYKDKLLKLKDIEVVESIINHYEEQRKQEELDTPIPAGRVDSSMTEVDSRLEGTFEDEDNSRYTIAKHDNTSSQSSAAAAAAIAAFGLVDYGDEDDDDNDNDLPTNNTIKLDDEDNADNDKSPIIPAIGLKRQSSSHEKRLSQRRRVIENEDDSIATTPPSPSPSSSDQSNGTDKISSLPLDKKKSGHLRRTLATAGKKLSVTFKRDKDKAVTSD